MHEIQCTDGAAQPLPSEYASHVLKVRMHSLCEWRVSALHVLLILLQLAPAFRCTKNGMPRMAAQMPWVSTKCTRT